MRVKLIIKDEVNVKIEGLSLADRKTLSNQFKYEVPGARYLPAVRLGRWDGRVAFFQLGGSTYINLLPEIIPYLEREGYEIELEDTRAYSTSFSFNEIKETTFAEHLWPKGHPLAGEPILLRDYQLEIINNFLLNPQSVQEVATGAGKTLVTAALSWSVQPYGRSIVIVPNKSLVTQTEEDFLNLKLDTGIYFGDRKDYNRTHTICTWQSLNNLLKGTKNHEAEIPIGEFLDGVVCVMVDEVHQAKADALKSLLTGPFSHIPIRWGLTGTIPKEEYAYRSIYCGLGNLVGKLAAKDLQDAGYLAQCHVNILQLVDFVEYKSYQTELKYLVETAARLDFLANKIAEISQSGNTLVLVDRVNTGKELVRRLGDRAVFISGSTKVKDRKEEYNEVAVVDDKTIVATYGVAAVGINIPRIFNLILLESGKSFTRVIQSIGRGIRKAEDKDFVQIWDVTSTCKFSKRHLTKRKSFYNEAHYPFTIEKIHWQ